MNINRTALKKRIWYSLYQLVQASAIRQKPTILPTNRHNGVFNIPIVGVDKSQQVASVCNLYLSNCVYGVAFFCEEWNSFENLSNPVVYDVFIERLIEF
jgi:hypothetical protein